MNTVRIRFEKRGEAAYISLLDLQRVIHRALKCSGLPVWYTEGFNPHIYLTFACPLALGQESVCESCDVKTSQEPVDYAVWKIALDAVMPQSLRVTSVGPAGEKSGAIAFAEYHFCLPNTAQPVLTAYNALTQATVEKKTKRGSKTIDLKEYVPTLPEQETNGELRFSLKLPAGDALNISPALLLEFLRTTGEPGALEPWKCQVVRQRLLLADGSEFI